MEQTFASIPKGCVALYGLTAPLSALASVIFSMALQPVLDVGLSGDWTAFARVSLWALAWGALDQLFDYLANMGRQRVRARYVREWRVSCFAGFFRQRMDCFLGRDTAEHLSRLTADAETVGDQFCGSALKMYRSLWSLAISMAAIIRIRWELAAFAVVFSLVAVNLPKLFQRSVNAAEAAYLASGRAHLAEAQESVRGYLLIRLHNLAASRVRRYDGAAAELEAREIQRRRRYQAVGSVAAGISQLSFAAIIIFAVALVMGGKISIGYVLSVSQLLGGVMVPFEGLPRDLTAFRAGRELRRSIEGGLREALETEGTEKVDVTGGSSVDIRDLSFAYAPDRPLLEGINLTLEMGKKYALVGASGSGKSTLSKVIMGFLRPCGGSVTVCGVPIEAVEKNSLYRAVSYQSQTVTLLNDTIKNNILLGASLSREEWERVIRSARLEEMLEKLPQGENTAVGEGGRNVSGGEAQRIGLARCLARNPQFVIFDEIAAALDSRNAGEIEKTILSLPETGALMITHRVYEESMRRCHRIFVLKDGRLVEQGTWDELMGRRGELFRLAAPSGGA